jgi:hypothetical protein
VRGWEESSMTTFIIVISLLSQTTDNRSFIEEYENQSIDIGNEFKFERNLQSESLTHSRFN